MACVKRTAMLSAQSWKSTCCFEVHGADAGMRMRATHLVHELLDPPVNADCASLEHQLDALYVLE